MGFTFSVCVCYRTQGTHVRGELSSVAEISTIATDACILLFLHSCHQVRWTHTHFCSHRFSLSEILPHSRAWVALQTGSLRQPWVVMGSDSLNCYKPQCGAEAKWHMLLRELGGRGGGGEAGDTEPAGLLVLSPSNEKDSLSLGPAWVSCLGTDVRYLSICHSPANTHTLSFCSQSLPISHSPLHFSQPHSLSYNLQANCDKLICQVSGHFW